MARERSNKRARRADAVEGEPSAQQQAASAAGDAGELSALERLHPDVLAEVLQLVGFAEVSRMRAVSKTMNNAVDNVAWRSLRLVASSVEQIERAAASFDQPQQPAKAPGARTRRVRAAKGCTLKLFIRCELGDRLEAVGSLFAACSRSSGGLGAFSLVEACPRPHDCYPSDYQHALVVTALEPLSASEAGGGSSRTLKSISVTFSWHCDGQRFPYDIVRLLGRFPCLERLQLPCNLNAAAAGVSNAVPSLRSARVWVSEGVDLAPFASHPALEELDVSLHMDEFSPGFEAFAAGPAARRLKKLAISFGSWGFNVKELPSLGLLTSLEKLELSFRDGTNEGLVQEVFGADAYVQALAGLSKLRELRLVLSYEHSAASLRDLARAIAALRAHSLVNMHLAIYSGRRRAHLRPVRAEDELDEAEAAEAAAAAEAAEAADAALAELLRAAGPALVELKIGEALLQRHAAQALLACARLRKLDLYPPLTLAEAEAVLATCPRLEAISGLLIRCNDERQAAEGLEALRRLAAACSLGSGSGCSFILDSGYTWEKRPISQKLVKERILSIFPKAEITSC